MDRLRDADTTLVVPNPLDIPPPGSIHDKPGFFVDCDLEAGFLGTPFRAYWANMITECIRNAILKAGIAPEYTDWTQLGLAIEKIADRIARELINILVPPMIEAALDNFEFVQEGGNVTGTIKGGTFTLNAPEGPAIPDVLVQDGGNVSGTISIADGKFTLTAADAGGGGEGVDKFIDLTDTPNGYAGVADGGALLFSRNDGIDYTQTPTVMAGWDRQRGLGISGGSVRASGGDGYQCLFGGTAGDGLQPINFTSACYLGIFQPPDPSRNFLICVANSLDMQAKITLDGVFYGRNTVIQAADYAEWFEGEADLPPGLSVVVDDSGPIRPFDPATDIPDAIIGVTRPKDTRAALIGNAAEGHWAGMYLTDDFGAPVWTEARDVDGRVYRTQAVNPDYDASRPYVPRSLRPEWSLVGLLGQIPVRDGQPLHPRWRRLRPLAEGVSLILVR